MPNFSNQSLAILSECHHYLQEIAREVIVHYDVSVTEGHRPRSEQDAKVEAGLSQVEWPNSKHNKIPSEAIHFLPYPFHGWENTAQFVYMAGYVMAIADRILEHTPYRLRWGGNWDMDTEVVTDQEFDDLAHFELVQR